MEFKINIETTCKRHLQIRVQQIYFPYQTLQTTKTNFEKFLGW